MKTLKTVLSIKIKSGVNSGTPVINAMCSKRRPIFTLLSCDIIYNIRHVMLKVGTHDVRVLDAAGRTWVGLRLCPHCTPSRLGSSFHFVLYLTGSVKHSKTLWMPNMTHFIDLNKFC